MKILIGLSIIDVICMFIVNPFNLFTWATIFTTGSFVLRPFGIYVKATKLMAVEGLILFMVFNGSLVFKTFSIVTYIIMIGIRLIFYGIVRYDDTQYVYVTEEEEKEI